MDSEACALNQFTLSWLHDCLGNLDLEKNMQIQRSHSELLNCCNYSAAPCLLPQVSLRRCQGRKKTIAEAITLENLSFVLSFCQLYLVAFLSLQWSSWTPLLEPRCDHPSSAKDQCHSMKRWLFFLNQLILPWDPQTHFHIISSFCFELSVSIPKKHSLLST